VLSSVVTRDYIGITADEIVAEVMTQATPGAVIALHDGGGPREQIVIAVERLIPLLRRQGYRFLTIDELRAVDEPSVSR